MQHINRLWQMVSAANTLRDMAQKTKTYYFAIQPHMTFYLHIADAEVELIRWERPMIEMTVRLDGVFGWKVAVDQDEAGVYVAARRRPIVGEISYGRFEVRCPRETYNIFRLEGCKLTLNDVTGEFHLPTHKVDSPLLLSGK
ncbi:MAG: hypothetical protein SFZ02_04615 [bacterium]|nr:hypothetical protein [bacterium]